MIFKKNLELLTDCMLSIGYAIVMFLVSRNEQKTPDSQKWLVKAEKKNRKTRKVPHLQHLNFALENFSKVRGNANLTQYLLF